MSRITDARTSLAGDLSSLMAAEPLFRGGSVLPYGVAKTFSKPQIIVRLSEVSRGAVRGLRVVELEVFLVSPLTEPGKSDDELDSLLDILLDQIDGLDQVIWTGTTRAVWEDAYPAYRVTCTWED